MTPRTSLLCAVIAAALSFQAPSPGHDYPVQPVPFTAATRRT
jgi:hypothetical protein